MLIFFICLVLLALAYRFYSPFVERQAGIDPKALTPQARFKDGVDYVPVHPVKAFLIQFLNVAGVGPIFGPILGALYGPIALVWIVLGILLAVLYTIIFRAYSVLRKMVRVCRKLQAITLISILKA